MEFFMKLSSQSFSSGETVVIVVVGIAILSILLRVANNCPKNKGKVTKKEVS